MYLLAGVSGLRAFISGACAWNIVGTVNTGLGQVQAQGQARPLEFAYAPTSFLCWPWLTARAITQDLRQLQMT